MLRVLKSLLVKAVAPAVLAMCAAAPAQAANLTVSGTASGTTLANTILGSGVTISNVAYTGGASGNNFQSGTFTGGLGSGLSFDNGILLTTGVVSNAPGPNSTTGASFAWGSAGDSTLTALANQSTNDAAVLQFDFNLNPGSTSVFFNFQFASEEYNEFVNQFNDVFGFFVDGTAAANNIAVIPNTNTPISINTVNLGVNSQYYNNNDPNFFGLNTTPFNLQYDGFTKMFTVSANNLSAGTHHIKIAIADGGDTNLDSAVFIQGGTFSNTATTPEPASMTLLGLGIAGLAGYGWRKRKTAA